VVGSVFANFGQFELQAFSCGFERGLNLLRPLFAAVVTVGYGDMSAPVSGDTSTLWKLAAPIGAVVATSPTDSSA
jgi:hypothetical protein